MAAMKQTSPEDAQKLSSRAEAGPGFPELAIAGSGVASPVLPLEQHA